MKHDLRNFERENDADQTAAAAGQLLSLHAGGIADLSKESLQTGPRLGAYPWLLIDDPRYRRDRDFRLFGDVMNGYLSLAGVRPRHRFPANCWSFRQRNRLLSSYSCCQTDSLGGA